MLHDMMYREGGGRPEEGGVTEEEKTKEAVEKAFWAGCDQHMPKDAKLSHFFRASELNTLIEQLTDWDDITSDERCVRSRTARMPPAPPICARRHRTSLLHLLTQSLFCFLQYCGTGYLAPSTAASLVTN